jgi:hypothetical protein
MLRNAIAMIGALALVASVAHYVNHDPGLAHLDEIEFILCFIGWHVSPGGGQ